MADTCAHQWDASGGLPGATHNQCAHCGLLEQISHLPAPPQPQGQMITVRVFDEFSSRTGAEINAVLDAFTPCLDILIESALHRATRLTRAQITQAARAVCAERPTHGRR